VLRFGCLLVKYPATGNIRIIRDRLQIRIDEEMEWVP
jgi:hypothetical protein